MAPQEAEQIAVPGTTRKSASLLASSMASPRNSTSTTNGVVAQPPSTPLRRYGSNGESIQDHLCLPSEALEGYLLKRGSHISSYVRWNDRYFILRPEEGTLNYYVQRGDVKPKGVIALRPECTVSDVYIAYRKGEKKSAPASGAPAAILVEETEESGGSSERYALAEERESSEREQEEVKISELTARQKQPVTKRLASTVYGSSSGNKSGSSGKTKSKKGREKLYCIKISWLRSDAAAKATATAELVDSSSAEDDNILEIPAVTSTDSAEVRQQYLAQRAAPASPRLALSPRVQPPSPSQQSMMSGSSDGLRGTHLLPEDSVHSEPGATITPTKSSTVKKSLLSSLPRPSYGRSKGEDLCPDPNVIVRSSSATVVGGESLIKPGRVSHNRRVVSDAVGPGSAAETVPYSLPPRTGKGSSSTLPPRRYSADGGNALDLPVLPSVLSRDSMDTNAPHSASINNNGAAESGIAKHYQTQVALQKHQSEEEYNKAMQLMYVSAKRAAYKRNKKRFVQGSKIAAAAAAVTTASILTAGVGLAVGLTFVGITAAAGGSGAMAEATYKRSKDSTSLVIAAPTLEEAHAWRDAILATIELQAGGGVAGVSSMRSAVPATLADVGDPRVPRSPSGSPRNKGVVDVSAGKMRSLGDPPVVDGQVFGMPVGFETQWIPVDTSPSLLGIGGGFSSTGGMRIFREEPLLCNDALSSAGTSRSARQTYRRRKSILAVVGAEGQYACLPLKASVVLPASPLEAFMCLMSHNRIENPGAVPLVPNSGQRASFRIVETIDDHCDIIHLVHRPLYLFPSWTAPRDYVLFRYWRFDPDGTYMICYDSVEHRECPPMPGYVRGTMYGVQTIAPKRQRRKAGVRGAGANDDECLLTHHVQVDPKGWVPKSLTLSDSYFPTNVVKILSGMLSTGYVEAFGVSALLSSLDVKDSLDNDRFVQLSMDSTMSTATSWKRNQSFSGLGATVAQEASSAKHGGIGGPLVSIEPSHSVDEDEDAVFDYRFVEREVAGQDELSIDEATAAFSCATHPEPCGLPYWAAPDANSFLTRGKNYLEDRKKYNAGDSVFRLFAVDMVETDGTIYSGMCAHPKERVQRAIRREQQGLPSDLPPYVVCMNIAVAGPPWYNMVFYYAVDDRSMVDGTNGTPFSKLASEFFFGDSDEMRDETFKLIPRVVEGNFMVRKAVGSTPAIMGNKLKQHYIRTDRYFELLLDTGSSSVAAGVIRLVLGYSKTVVVDMAFLLEGKDESTLPEKVFGAVRLKNYVFCKELTRFVPFP